MSREKGGVQMLHGVDGGLMALVEGISGGVVCKGGQCGEGGRGGGGGGGGGGVVFGCVS